MRVKFAASSHAAALMMDPQADRYRRAIAVIQHNPSSGPEPQRVSYVSVAIGSDVD